MSPADPTVPRLSSSRVERVLHSRLLPLSLLVAAAAASLLSLGVDDDATDTALGAVAGASVTLLLFVLLLQVLAHRQRSRDDLRRLDGLEPLRAARRAAPGRRPDGEDR